MMPKYYHRLSQSEIDSLKEDIVNGEDEIAKLEAAIIVECKKVLRCRRLKLRHKDRVPQMRDRLETLRHNRDLAMQAVSRHEAEA